MTATLLALLLGPPALDVRRDFPPHYAAEMQVERCHAHAAWLREMRSHRGYEDGRWDEWIRQTREHEAAWAILAGAEPDLHEATMRGRMEAYRKLVGDQRYLKRWTPPEMPYQEPSEAPNPAGDKP